MQSAWAADSYKGTNKKLAREWGQENERRGDGLLMVDRKNGGSVGEKLGSPAMQSAWAADSYKGTNEKLAREWGQNERRGDGLLMVDRETGHS